MFRPQRLATALAVSTLLAAGACEDDAPASADLTVPSGRVVEFLDVVTNAPGAKGATARFRFVAKGLAAGDDASADMEALCNSYAVPRIGGMVPEPQQVVIVLADRAVPFGETAPDAVQFFEAYAVKDNTCIWEVF